MSKIETTGRHEVTVSRAEFGESDKGTPFLQLSFEDKNGDFIQGWLYLSEAAFENSLRTLRDAFKFDGNFETLPAQVIGKACSITVEVEQFEGKDRFKVKWINALRTPPKPIQGGNSALQALSAKAARIPVETSRRAPAKSESDFPSDPARGKNPY